MEPGKAVTPMSTCSFGTHLQKEEREDSESCADHLYEIRRLIDSIASKEDALLTGDADAAMERYVWAECGAVCNMLCAVLYMVLCDKLLL